MPGSLLVGRYPYVEPSRCKSYQEGEAKLEQILKAGITTFMSLQVSKREYLGGVPAGKTLRTTGVVWCRCRQHQLHAAAQVSAKEVEKKGHCQLATSSAQFVWGELPGGGDKLEQILKAGITAFMSLQVRQRVVICNMAQFQQQQQQHRLHALRGLVWSWC